MAAAIPACVKEHFMGKLEELKEAVEVEMKAVEATPLRIRWTVDAGEEDKRVFEGTWSWRTLHPSRYRLFACSGILRAGLQCQKRPHVGRGR